MHSSHSFRESMWRLAPRVYAIFFVYYAGIDGFNGGSLFGSDKTPFDAIGVVRVKIALTLRKKEHQKYESGRLFIAEMDEIIHRSFNHQRRLAALGRLDGKSVRMRILFSPRYIVRTPPTGSSPGRADYFEALDISSGQTEAYAALVDDTIRENGIHADVVAVGDPKKHGNTSTAFPREAIIDTDDLEDETIRLFGSMVGLAKSTTRRPSDYALLIGVLAPEFKPTSLYFVEAE